MKSLKQMLDELVAKQHELNDWEQDFVRNCSLLVQNSRGSTTVLTGNRADKIDEIYHERILGQRA